MLGTCSSHNGTLCQQTTEDLYAGAIEEPLDNLTTGHIGICRIRQESGQELRAARESRSWIRTIENVVGQQGSDETGIGGRSFTGCRVEECRNSVIVGREDCDVGCVAES
jgi:hypothetical protein